jgi:hypothetical protein
MDAGRAPLLDQSEGPTRQIGPRKDFARPMTTLPLCSAYRTWKWGGS